MRICPNNQSGSTLIVTVLVTGILGVMLAAFVKLAGFQNHITARSHAWNAALPVAESGVEEALTHLYHADLADLATNGWTRLGTTVTRIRTNDSTRVSMVISNTAQPVIYSRGESRIAGRDNTFVKRTVRVKTRRDALFSKAIVAKEDITLNGNNILVDSFDSADPNHSTGGVYDPAKRKNKGDIATNSSVRNALDTGNANIYGRVSTGPGGAVEIGPKGKVGDLAWQASTATKGIQPGWSTDDMNVLFPDVELPFSSGLAPPIVSGDYQIAASGDYALFDLTRSLIVQSNAHARLLIKTEIALSGSERIEIQPGGSLQLYMAGWRARILGNGVVNRNGNATNFVYRGTRQNHSAEIAGNGSLTGVIYAPDAHLRLSGSGAGVEDVVGAAVAQTAILNGQFQFHYDENLARLYRDRPFVVIDWEEL